MDVDIQSLCRLCAKRCSHSINVLSKSENQNNSFSNLIQEFFSVIVSVLITVTLITQIMHHSHERERERVKKLYGMINVC